MIADRSRKALSGVHPDLVKVLERADANGLAFVVVCGRRTIEQQRELVAQGKSRTMKSRHLTGHAVDLVDAGFTWSEPSMREIATGIKQAAGEVGVPIEWGGDWKSFVDTPHFQLPAAQYPDGDRESHSISNAAESISNVPAKPLTRSGTIWGSVGTSFAGLGLYLESGWEYLLSTAAAWSELGPARDMLAQIAGNGKAMSLGLLAGCVAIIISRRVKASQEGKPG